MSLTYTDDTRIYAEDARPVDAVRHEPFTPVYARSAKSRSKGGVKTWMILAPIGVIALGAFAAVTLTGGGETTEADMAAAPVEAPLAAPVAPLVAEPMMEAPIAADAMPMTATPAPAPVARQAPVGTQPRAAAPRPAARVAATQAPAPVVVETPAEPVGPRPYVADAAPATSTTTPPAPLIVVEPLN